MPFTRAAVEMFISAKASAITRCGASEVSKKVPELDHWLTHFGLLIICNNFPPATYRLFALNLIRRIYAVFLEYDLAREEVRKLVKDGNGRWSPYFAALTHFEMAISQLYVALDSIRKLMDHNFFTRGDGSFEEKLNFIYNASKHDIAETELPVWFTDDGLACTKAEITFAELEDFMLKMAGLVKAFSEPKNPIQA